MSDSLLKPRSRALTDGASRAGARSMLRAYGLKDDDFKKPLIGVANTWIEIGPCNYHLRELAQHVKEGIRAAGGTPQTPSPPAALHFYRLAPVGFPRSLCRQQTRGGVA